MTQKNRDTETLISTKTQDHYGEKIKLEKGNAKKGNIIFSASLDHGDFIIKAEVSFETKIHAKMRDATYTAKNHYES